MATTYPTGTTTSDSSAITTLVGVLALITIVALVYFIVAGGRDNRSTVTGPTGRAGQTTDNPAGAPAVPNPGR
jgi:hypothetical protein